MLTNTTMPKKKIAAPAATVPAAPKDPETLPPVPEEATPPPSDQPLPDAISEPLPPEDEFEDVPVEVARPMFEGAQVVDLVTENVNGRWHRCTMTDGTTKDVPVELFRTLQRRKVETTPTAHE